jgi:hypothetical protein
MLINLNTAIQALQSHDGIGSKEEAIKVLEGLRDTPRDDSTVVMSIVRGQGTTGPSILIGDMRVAGPKQYGCIAVIREWKVNRSQVEKALYEP